MSGNKIQSVILFLVLAMFGCKNNTTNPEISEKGSIKTGTVESAFLSANINYSVYVPPGYSSSSNTQYPILYLLHGFWGTYEDWPQNGLKTAVDNMLGNNAATPMIIVMPDGLDAFYCNNYDERNLQYESFFVEEFIPAIETEYRVQAGREHRAIAGLSMGGFGATYHAMKYQGMYSYAYSMSGALDLGGNEPDIREIINAKSAAELTQLPVYQMDIGTEDFLYSNNVSFSQFLNSKNISHQFQERAGSHDWDFWMTSLPGVIAGYSDLLTSEN